MLESSSATPQTTASFDSFSLLLNAVVLMLRLLRGWQLLAAFLHHLLLSVTAPGQSQGLPVCPRARKEEPRALLKREKGRLSFFP